MDIASFYESELLRRHHGDPFKALADACDRLAVVTPGVSFGMIRAEPYTPPKPAKRPPPDPLDVEKPDAD